MVRAVPTLQGDRSDTGVIWAGWSDDGCTFEMDDAPAIVPGPGEVDVGGVEDPTVLCMEDGYVVYYTGVQADFARGNMIYATGQSLDALEKQGVALASSKQMRSEERRVMRQGVRRCRSRCPPYP